jgi:hypothetical protein
MDAIQSIHSETFLCHFLIHEDVNGPLEAYVRGIDHLFLPNFKGVCIYA